MFGVFLVVVVFVIVAVVVVACLLVAAWNRGRLFGMQDVCWLFVLWSRSPIARFNERTSARCPSYLP